MDAPVARRSGETEAHLQLKRLALLWAQANGYPACALEVSLPRCRYRADVAAFRPRQKRPGVTAIFECKQALTDLRRDNCNSVPTRERLRAVTRRREIIEKHLRIHYPTLRTGDSLFPEYDSHDFTRIGHRGYSRVLRELAGLQTRLNYGLKFECLMRYRCANLFFLVLPNHLFCESNLPPGWGALVEDDGLLSLLRRPVWHDSASESSERLLLRIAAAGTRQLNRTLGLTSDQLQEARRDAEPFF